MTASILLIGALLFTANSDATQSPEEMERRLNKSGGNNPTVQKAVGTLHSNEAQIRAAMAMKGHKPKTCEDKCDMIEKQSLSMTDTPQPNQPAGKKKPTAASTKASEKNMKEIAKVCRDSCTSKGKIDKQYIIDHMPKATSPYPAGGSWSGGGGGSKSSSSSSSDSQ